MRTTILAAAAVALSATLVGCSGEDEPTRPPAAPVPAQSSEDAAVEEPTASADRYAYVVSLSNLPDDLAAVSECDWSGGDALDRPLPARCAGAGGVRFLSLGGQRIAEDLTNAQDPSSPDFVGAPPPPELAPLLSDTITGGKELSAAARAVFEEGCVETGAGRCAPLRRDLVRAIDAMETHLDAWAPYL